MSTTGISRLKSYLKEIHIISIHLGFIFSPHFYSSVFSLWLCFNLTFKRLQFQIFKYQLFCLRRWYLSKTLKEMRDVWVISFTGRRNREWAGPESWPVTKLCRWISAVSHMASTILCPLCFGRCSHVFHHCWHPGHRYYRATQQRIIVEVLTSSMPRNFHSSLEGIWCPILRIQEVWLSPPSHADGSDNTAPILLSHLTCFGSKNSFSLISPRPT